MFTYTDKEFLWPCDTKNISSYFSSRTLSQYNSSHFHNGIDIPSRQNSNVYSIIDGTVVFADFYGAYGYTIIVSHYNSYKSQYSHLSENFLVKVGDYIKRGEQIGFVGPKYLPSNSKKYYLSPGNVKTNGMTTGPHLHFSLFKDGKVVDPLSVSYKKWHIRVLSSNVLFFYSTVISLLSSTTSSVWSSIFSNWLSSEKISNLDTDIS